MAVKRKAYKRIFLIVIDSLGIGAAKDAEQFGDAGADTLGHIVEHVKIGRASCRERVCQYV